MANISIQNISKGMVPVEIPIGTIYLLPGDKLENIEVVNLEKIQKFVVVLNTKAAAPVVPPTVQKEVKATGIPPKHKRGIK